MDKDIVESVNLENLHNDFIYNAMIIFFIIIIILIIYNVYNYNSDSDKDAIYLTENMTNGTLTQLYANDAQDVNLKSNVDNLATGNFLLNWNNSTRLTNRIPNRGQLVVPNDSVDDNNNSYVNLKTGKLFHPNNTIYYPDSYVGSYYINPNPDIMKPLPIIPPSNRV